MQIGLIGLQNSGKTTLFNALSEKTSEAQHQQKSEVSRAVVKVPDIRLDKLTELFKPKSKVFATLEVIDIPGLQVSDDNKVKITSDFLNRVKNNNALLHVVRQFENDSVPHPEVSINTARDIEFLETEFLLADMALIENRLEKLAKDILKLRNDQLQKEMTLFKKMQIHVEKELPLRELVLDENERKLLSGYQFLTIKPLIIGINFDENSKDEVEDFIKNIQRKFSKYPLIAIPFFAQFEYELTQLSEEEAEIFKNDFGIHESAFTRILRTSYELLGLQSFFTVGVDECRAWTIKKNMTAQDAAGVIHTDFYDRFIRAEVVQYEDYLVHGSFPKCKEAGAWRLEGKEYVVKDGDILNIRHS
ncbi:MAG: redox-regulated ATPase YchF [Ignavibacteria bacterium CG22_combo_CG10-13_8_21_14_all_37_15]|nr:redox-regulated ATPase YchF [Ignavibacteria bacterium]OIO18501.1 MAG: redox-regulated ATPase YchF [Ignavibacteria bacterium CG1_02_37_35]PIP78813.1 MAG: redox-regulated ATPase YchF [Ignavibacteria bacterium CG22_combo_CG10-13_8_21_14_all_37_15]PIX94057.1 MAG: redox-regulated ATPase YchF [Ignavibacteria bacterium CG_4_10_14_3_um_filter_37_18]PJC60638.1 MAG: redox-regulated ATPase YchF [Ignavibacteria bacterium CG_4_9_14_0_2_um_filter_37_13]